MEIEITHSTIQMLVITLVVPQCHLFPTLRRHGNGCFSDCCSQNYTVLCTSTTGKRVRAFSREQKKIACPHAFSCCCQLWNIIIRSFMIVCAAIIYQTSCQITIKCHHTHTPWWFRELSTDEYCSTMGIDLYSFHCLQINIGILNY